MVERVLPGLFGAWVVASTGEVMAAGPIRRADLIAELAAEGTAEAQTDALEGDLERLAARLGVAWSHQVSWVETPIAVRTLTEEDASAVVEVWSVAVVAADDGGVAPQQLWRTTRLDLVAGDGGGWRVAGAVSSPGPTPGVPAVVSGPGDRTAVLAAAAGDRPVLEWGQR